jgi:hypothetical protein
MNSRREPTMTMPGLCRGGRLLPALAVVVAVVGASSPARAQTQEARPELLGRLRQQVWPSIVGGHLTPQRLRRSGQIESSSRGLFPQRLETLSYSFDDQVGIALDYQFDAGDSQLKISWHAGQTFEIRQQKKDQSVTHVVSLRQVEGAGLRVEVGTLGELRTIDAPTFWHLVLSEPRIAREDVIPLLERWRVTWGLRAMADELEAALVRSIASLNASHSQQWSQLIKDLGSSSHARRRNADRELRELGAAAVPFLYGLNTAQLTPEQRFRVRRILEAQVAESGEDRPERAAMMLLGDARVWHALAERDDVDVRRTASEQLTRLLGDARFDAEGPADARQRQLAELRARIDAMYRAPAPAALSEEADDEAPHDVPLPEDVAVPVEIEQAEEDAVEAIDDESR